MTNRMLIHEVADYRTDALNRIASAPELNKCFSQLRENSWASNLPIWKWIAEATITDLLFNAENFSPNQLERVAYHEAGHAVLACLTFMDIVEVTAIPDPYSDKAGEVLMDAEIPIGKWWVMRIFGLGDSLYNH